MKSGGSVRNSLSGSELQFLKEQNIDIDSVFDSRGLKSAEAKRIAKEQGLNFLLGAKCKKAGHRLRTRQGHCIQCHPSKIRYQLRHNEAGYVYLAKSKNKSILKIGCSDNPKSREKMLNNNVYGGTSDWEMFECWHVDKKGKIEQSALGLLRDYAVAGTYMKDGKLQQCDELIACSLDVAVDAILKSIHQSGKSKSKKPLSKQIKPVIKLSKTKKNSSENTLIKPSNDLGNKKLSFTEATHFEIAHQHKKPTHNLLYNKTLNDRIGDWLHYFLNRHFGKISFIVFWGLSFAIAGYIHYASNSNGSETLSNAIASNKFCTTDKIEGCSHDDVVILGNEYLNLTETVDLYFKDRTKFYEFIDRKYVPPEACLYERFAFGTYQDRRYTFCKLKYLPSEFSTDEKIDSLKPSRQDKIQKYQ